MSDDRLTIGHVAGPVLNERVPVAMLLHGFTQNRHCWGSFADVLGQRYTVLGIDLPGHGDSLANEVSFERAAKLVGDALATVDGPIDTLVGYSMGGRMALRLVVDQPDACSRLVVLGATAGLVDPGDRERRRSADAALAARLREEGPDKFLDFWLGLELFAGLSHAQQFRTERIAHWGSGVPETLECRGTGNMEPVWPLLHSVNIPVLVLAGERDQKFTDIGRAISDHIGANGTFETIPDTGHACHLEDPDRTASAVLRWSSDFGSAPH